METLPDRLLLLGLGRSVEAVAAYAAKQRERGAAVAVTALDEDDRAAARERAERFRALGADARTGVSAVEGAFDLAVASPGIPPHSALMRSARDAGIPVISEIELAWRLSGTPWVAVTGTNGKSTVTALVAHLLRASGIASEAVGNYGPVALEAALETGEGGVLSVEVSSFQLALTERFHPRVAVLLNITPDHIDYHGSLEAYASDKAKVFANLGAADLAVIDVDDEGSAPWADRVAASGVPVCRVSRTAAHPGGAWVEDGTLTVDGPHGPIALVDASELRILGAHNVSNALAAAAAALGAGATAEGVREGLRGFEPIEHRLEPVATVRGVEFYNDSKATNPDAVLKALASFPDRDVIVLLGGRSKGSSFEELAARVSETCRLAVIYGECAEDLAAAFRDVPVPMLRADDLAGALGKAADAAVPGDVVLLSPACKSFDGFTSFEHRGQVFKELVGALDDGAASARGGEAP